MKYDAGLEISTKSNKYADCWLVEFSYYAHTFPLYIKANSKSLDNNPSALYVSLETIKQLRNVTFKIKNQKYYKDVIDILEATVSGNEKIDLINFFIGRRGIEGEKYAVGFVQLDEPEITAPANYVVLHGDNYRVYTISNAKDARIA